MRVGCGKMLSRMPTVSISDLQKGEAVMLVATEGSASSSPTAITLLTGVEPILALLSSAGATGSGPSAEPRCPCGKPAEAPH